ncbi:MAG: amidase [Acidobacteria bacterium]|nr:amidase [Acidobacteriota bacterium]
MSRSRNTRRSFLKAASTAAFYAPFISLLPRAGAQTKKFDPSFGTATQTVKALRSGVISSRELTEHVFKRIAKHNPKINAFITLIEEQAMEQAKKADELTARKKATGKLHGLPIVIKDTFATAGVRTTSGSKQFEKYIPKEDAVVVARLKAAGAIIIGKTNLPELAADWQSYNQVAGVTNNPWDLSRTPGGSTGGGAAALAAGLGFLEIGSDIGGSIRIPSHFCGLFGHKPTLDIVPLAGHIPPSPGLLAPAELPVAGPLARSAEDLLLELDVVAGPAPEEAVTYRWSLPKPRKTKLSEYKIGFAIDDPYCPVDSAMKEVLAGAIESLRKAGAQLSEGWPKGVNPQAMYDNYMFLLSAILNAGLPEAAIKGMLTAAESGVKDPWVLGATTRHLDWRRQTEQRFRARAVWREYFKNFDAFLLPVNFVPAFPHDHKPDLISRKLATAEGERNYIDQSRWICFATLAGCPATVAPVERTKSGLPVGIQIMGPYLEDATPIDIALNMDKVFGGFTPPQGYEG